MSDWRQWKRTSEKMKNHCLQQTYRYNKRCVPNTGSNYDLVINNPFIKQLCFSRETESENWKKVKNISKVNASWKEHFNLST